MLLKSYNFSVTVLMYKQKLKRFIFQYVFKNRIRILFYSACPRFVLHLHTSQTCLFISLVKKRKKVLYRIDHKVKRGQPDMVC